MTSSTLSSPPPPEKTRVQDTTRLGKAFEELKDVDIKASPEAVPTEAMASQALVREYLEIFAELIHDRLHEPAARIATFMSEELGNLHALDKKLWPEVEATYEAHAGQPLPTETGPTLDHDPKAELTKFFPDQKSMKQFAGMSLMDALRRATGKAGMRSLVMLLALQGACREAFPDEEPTAIEISRSKPADTAPMQSVLAVLHTDKGEVRASGSSRERSSETPTMAELFETVSATTSFALADLSPQIAKSVGEHPESWGVTPDQAADAAERIETRLWEAITFIGGVNGGDDTVVFEDRKVMAKGATDAEPREYPFSASEQQDCFRRWLTLNEGRLGGENSQALNLPQFSKREPLSSKKIAGAVDQLLPYGFFQFTSGFRDDAAQRDTIWKLARSKKVDLSPYDPENPADVSDLVKKLRREHGVFVLPPGESNHGKGRAVDVALSAESHGKKSPPPFWKLFGHAARVVGERVAQNPDLTLLIEKNNGNGVLHFDASTKLAGSMKATKSKG